MRPLTTGTAGSRTAGLSSESPFDAAGPASQRGGMKRERVGMPTRQSTASKAYQESVLIRTPSLRLDTARRTFPPSRLWKSKLRFALRPVSMDKGELRCTNGRSKRSREWRPSKWRRISFSIDPTKRRAASAGSIDIRVRERTSSWLWILRKLLLLLQGRRSTYASSNDRVTVRPRYSISSPSSTFWTVATVRSMSKFCRFM